MKFLPPLLGAALASAGAFSAQAAPANYLGAAYLQADVGAAPGGDFRANGTDSLLGPIALKEPLRTGYLADALVGRDVAGAPLAVEAEGLYVNNAIGSEDLNAALGASLGMRSQTWGGLANLKLQVRRPVAGLTVSPFLAAGVGYGRTAVSILGDHYDGGGLLWQGKAGVALEASPRFAWVLSYRYLGLPQFDTNKLGLVATLKTRAHAVTVGVRYSFR